MKHVREHGRHFNFNGLSGTAYLRDASGLYGDVAVIDVDGRHGRIKSLTGDRFYVVAEGEGSFTVGDETYPVGREDLIVVPRNTPYDFEGRMRVFVFCAPPYDPAGEVDLETQLA